jgi:hypothetical protein
MLLRKYLNSIIILEYCKIVYFKGGKDMQISLWKKGLVLGLLVLFFGIGLFPVVTGVDNVTGSVYISIDSSDESSASPILPFLKGLIVDQKVDSICGTRYGEVQIEVHMPVGQSFKPRYVCHYGIELYIEEMNTWAPLAPIQISLRENDISGPLVPRTNVILDLTTSGEGWRYFEFSSPVDLITGQTYVIDISTTTPRWGYHSTQGFCYTRGLCYFLGAPQPEEDLYFRTYVLVNKPPDAPTINGPTRGRPGKQYEYTFNATDPDGDDITNFTINWGDGPLEILEGPFASGSLVTANHTWKSEKTFTIMANAKDKWDAKSNWAYFDVEIPRNRASSGSLLYWLFERFPLLEKLHNVIK